LIALDARPAYFIGAYELPSNAREKQGHPVLGAACSGWYLRPTVETEV
jgi:hypothetical protein